MWRGYLPGYVDGSAAHVVALSDESQNLTLAELTALLEYLRNLSNFSCVNDREQTTTVQELVLVKRDAFLDILLRRTGCHFS